jgi:hypothetical protein
MKAHYKLKEGKENVIRLPKLRKTQQLWVRFNYPKLFPFQPQKCRLLFQLHTQSRLCNAENGIQLQPF